MRHLFITSSSSHFFNKPILSSISLISIFSVKFSQEEDDAIRDGASTFLPDISQVLSHVPREMLLVLKTNDHLRGLEVAETIVSLFEFWTFTIIIQYFYSLSFKHKLVIRQPTHQGLQFIWKQAENCQ